MTTETETETPPPAPSAEDIKKDLQAKVADLNEAIQIAAGHDVVAILTANNDWMLHSKQFPLVADILRRI